MSHPNIFPLVILFGIYNIFAQTVSLSGTVTDSTNTPLPGAIVSLKLSGLKDTTDSLGKFILSNQSSGKAGYGSQALPLLYNQPVIKSGSLCFSASQATKATIEIFTLRGQKVGNTIVQMMNQGNYSIPVGKLLPQTSVMRFYIIRLSLGKNTFAFKVNSMNNVRQASSAGGIIGRQNSGAAKIAAIVDTLIVKKPCFYPYSMPVDSLSGALPAIVLKADGFVIPNTTIPLDSAVIEKIANITDTTDSIMTFNSDSLSKYHLTLDTSSVLVFPQTSKSPQGLLRKIIEVSKSGSTVTFYTRKASLAEAIYKGHFDTTIILRFPDSLSLNKRAISGELNTSLTYHKSFSQDLITAGNEKVTAEGFIKTTGTIHLSGDINIHKVNNLVFTGAIDNTASLTITSTFDKTLDKKIKILSLPLTTIVVYMGLPFFITPVLELYVGASGNINSSTSANVTYTNSFTSGIMYDNNQWTQQNTSSQQFSATLPTLPQTTASLKAYTEADLICKIDCAIGPKLAATGSLQLKATIPGNPWWSLNTGLDIGAGINISVFDLTLLDTTFNLYNQSWPLLESAPINFKGTPGDGKVNLIWDVYTGADSFFVYMSTTSDLTTKNYAQKMKTTSQSFEADNLTNGQAYYFILTAHDQTSKIESFATLPISITPVLGVAAPQTPTLTSPLNGATGLSLTPTLIWSTINDAAIYHVQVSTVNTFSTIEVEDSTLTSATKTLIGPANGMQYYWRVQAKNAGRVSAWASPWSFTTTPAAMIPGSVQVTPSHAGTGQTFSQTGTGFTQNDSAKLFFVYPDAHIDSLAKATDATGKFTNSYTVTTSTPRGNYQFYARDRMTQIKTVAFPYAIDADITPSVQVTPSHGATGQIFNEPGAGFTPNSTAKLYFLFPDGHIDSTNVKTTDASGQYANNYTVPSTMPRGNYQYSARDVSTQIISNTVSFTVDADITPFVQVSPSHGATGQTFSEPGTGFTPNSTAKLYFLYPDGHIDSSVVKTTDASGQYSNSFAIATSTLRGSYQYSARDVSTQIISNTVSFTVDADITPSVQVTPSHAGTGQTFSQTGTGFTLNDSAKLFFVYPDAHIDSLAKTTDAAGKFSNSYTVTTSTPRGNYQFYARDRISRINAVAVYYTVDLDTISISPKVSVTPSSGATGDMLQEPGSGFTPNGSVELHFIDPSSADVVAATITADASGAYTRPYTITSGNALGTWQYYAIDKTTAKQSPKVSFSIVALVNPVVSVTPFSGATGDVLQEPGSGFTPNGSVELHFIDPSSADLVAATITADASGAYTRPYTVTSGNALGTWQYYAVDKTTGKQSPKVSFSIVSLVNPMVSVTPSSGATGDVLQEPGSGFTPNGSIELHFIDPSGTDQTVSPLVTADANGAYTRPYTITSGNALGTWQYYAIDKTTSKQSAKVSFTITKLGAPVVSVTPSSGATGDVLQEPGSGFTPNGSVELHFIDPSNTDVVAATVTADASGAYTRPYTVTSGNALGTWQYYAIDKTTSKQSPKVSFSIVALVNPMVSVTPSSGATGDVLQEPGSGFTPNGSVEPHFIDPSSMDVVAATVTADASGAYTRPYTVTSGNALGTWQYYAIDKTTGKQSAKVSFTITKLVAPVVSVTPSSGATGDVLQEPGSGFTPIGSVELHFIDPSSMDVVAATVTADASGAYTRPYTITSGNALGTWQYYAIDKTTGKQSAKVSFTITKLVAPVVSVTPSSGATGDVLQEPGSGFTPNGSVELHFIDPSSMDVVAATVTADASGAYTRPYTITSGNALGTWQYYAIDKTTGKQSAKVSFTIKKLVAPVVSVTPSSGATGDVLQEPGSGFTPNGSVELHFIDPSNTDVVAATVTADASGAYTRPYTITSGNALGTWQYYAIDKTTGKQSAKVSFTIKKLVAPVVSVTPSSGTTGNVLQEPGSGFTPNGSVELHFIDPSGVNVTISPLVTADANGAYARPFTVTAGNAKGTWQYYAIDKTTGKQSPKVSFTIM